MQQATFLKFYVHDTFVKCETITDFKGIWHADRTVPLVAPLVKTHFQNYFLVLSLQTVNS